MLRREQRNQIRDAQSDASTSVQIWLASRVRDADHGDKQSEKMLKTFLKEYRRTGSPRKAHGAVMLEYDQLTFEDIC